jgi:hypothetical protein
MVTKVGLWKQPSDPATVAQKGYVYSKEVNLITELFYKDGSDNVTQLTLNGKVKGNTLNQSYDEGGSGAGRTITVDSGPVTLVAGGAEALHADGYIGLTERVSDPTLLANSGLVYTKEVTGVIELFYMNTAGVTTQLTDNGAVPGMNKIQEGNTIAEVHDTGTDGYFFVRTEGGEKFRIGPNGGSTFTPELNTSINFNTSGTGLGVFANAIRVGTTTDTTAGNVRWTGTHFEGCGGTAWLQLDQTSADLTETGSDILTISGGTNAVMGSGTTIQIQKASALQDGYLGKDDFASFSATGTMIAQLDTKAYVKDTGVDGYFAVETNAVERFRLTFDGGMVIPSSSAAPTASNAMTYYDTDDNKFKFYENGTWNELGGTLNTSYNYGGAGAGRTITVNAGAVTLTATGGEALHTDGYIGIVKKAADPTAVANMGSVYTKDVNGITELFYFDSTGSYTQITDDGYLATANSLYQVGLYTKTWDPHANIGEGFIYTKWVDIETDKHSEFYFMDDKAQVTQITKDGSLNVVLTSPNGFKFELAVDDDGKISSKKLQ